MKRNTIAVVMMLLLLGGSLFASGQVEGEAQAQSQEPKLIRLSHTHQADAEASEIHFAATKFKEYVEANSDTLRVQIFPANALGEEREVYEAMQLGSGATAVISGTAILSNFNEKIGVLDLPFIWKGYDHVHQVLDGQVGDTLAGELESEGFKVLAWMDSWGYRNVYTAKNEVRSPGDLAGLKIRTIPTPIYVAAVNAMGANATPMAFGEVYTAMQTGVLDGFEHSASVVKAQRFYEVAKYGALTQHLFGPLAFVYSAAEWDKLTSQEQQVVLDGAAVARDEQRRLAPIKEAEGFDFLREQGMVFHEIDTAQFERNARGVQEEIAAERGALDLLQLIRNVQ
jgi:tripartite ATP-independent transporter DctP family solute receptor